MQHAEGQQPSQSGRITEQAQLSLNGFKPTVERLPNGTAMLTIEGELDLATAPRFESRLAQASAGASQVIVDLSRCEFLDASALHALLRTQDRLDPSQEITLVISTPNIVKVFEITYLDNHFPIEPTRDSALADRSEVA